MAKRKTNREVLAKMVRELDDVYIMMLRILILDAADDVIKNQDQIRADNQRCIIHPDLWIKSMEEIKKLADFDKEPNKNTLPQEKEQLHTQA